MNAILKRLLPLLVVPLLAACGDSPFDAHPYSTNISGEKDRNAPRIATIRQQFGRRDTLRVAFISDTHIWLKDFHDAVDDINGRDSIDFVMHCGDITDTGTAREFNWAADELDRLSRPTVVLIGNHDFLGTGLQTWQAMFGPTDFSFIVGRLKFVCVNTNATEYKDPSSMPDFDFLRREATADSAAYDRTVVVMHAAPGSDQFDNGRQDEFRQAIGRFKGLQCCIYGHDHTPKVGDIFGDGLTWYGIDTASHRQYCIFTFTPSGYSYETIHF